MRGRHRVVAIAAGLAAVSTARAEPAPSGAPEVAVVLQAAVNISESEAALVVAGLERALTRELVVTPLRRDAVSSRVPALSGDCLARTPCVRELIERLPVDDILTLVLVRVGHRYQIDATWIDGRSPDVVMRPRPQMRIDVGQGDLVAAFAPYASQLLPHRTPIDSGGITGREIGIWVAGGVGVAALATGATLGTMAMLRFDDCEDSGCTQDRIDSIEPLELGADIGFAVALAAGGTALGLWLFGTDEESPRMHAAPAPGGASVLFTGRF